MKYIIKNKLKGLAFMLLVFMASAGYSQSGCKGFARKNCKGDFEDYMRNPQTLEAEITEGEAAEISMVFSKDHDYRIFVCTEEHMGEVGFRIKTARGDILFDNSEYEMTDLWDFSMSSTRRLIIEVTFMGAGGGDAGFEQSGCAAILVGYRHSSQSGFR